MLIRTQPSGPLTTDTIGAGGGHATPTGISSADWLSESLCDAFSLGLGISLRLVQPSSFYTIEGTVA